MTNDDDGGGSAAENDEDEKGGDGAWKGEGRVGGCGGGDSKEGKTDGWGVENQGGDDGWWHWTRDGWAWWGGKSQHNKGDEDGGCQTWKDGQAVETGGSNATPELHSQTSCPASFLNIHVTS